MTGLSVLVRCFPFSVRHGCIYISKMFCKEKRYQCVYVCHLVIQSQTIHMLIPRMLINQNAHFIHFFVL